MAADVTAFTNPDKIAEAGERIYSDKYKGDFERLHNGKFAAIDVASGQAFVAQYPEQALQEGRKRLPNGIFHLVRIGSAGAFRVSYVAHAARAGLFR